MQYYVHNGKSDICPNHVSYIAYRDEAVLHEVGNKVRKIDR